MEQKVNHVELAIIGAGPAGMAAAIAARDRGVRDILILERDEALGGILQQCIHNGFGLHRYEEELTGPEYAWRLEQQVRALNIPILLRTMVTGISSARVISAVNEEQGLFHIEASAIILAMGCRERSRGALNIAGTRPAGIYTAGAAQRFVNMRGYLVGKRAVILGSGDIGLIMARRLTLEGAKVEAVLELLPYSGGLTRNIVQCLEDFDIPLLLSHTIVEIHGKRRVTGVTIAAVDDQRRVIAGSQRHIECDTVLFSVGLLPENELSLAAGVPLDPMTGGALVDQDRQTQVAGIFACGNVLHVHDLADYASEEAEIAGLAAARYLQRRRTVADKQFALTAADGVRYVVPQTVTGVAEDVKVYLRVADIYRDVYLTVKDGARTVLRRRKKIVKPGEMESITLKAASLAAVTGEQLTVALEKEERA